MASGQFMLSVIAGLVSASALGIVLWLIRVVWKNNIEPWWENKLYSDARIDGVWETKLVTEDQSDYREEAWIVQTGHSIRGTLYCTVGIDKGRSYKFAGVIRNTILSAYYWNSDKTAIDSGSFALRLEDNGDKLSGHTIYYYDTDHTLMPREYIWTRKKSPSNSGVQPTPYSVRSAPGNGRG
jgi:hypothetical protein